MELKRGALQLNLGKLKSPKIKELYSLLELNFDMKSFIKPRRLEKLRIPEVGGR